VRQRLDPLTYSAPVYLVCALMLAAITVAVRQPFAPLTLHNLALFLALALVCTLGGHLVYNWSLRYVDAAVVSVSFLGERSSPPGWPGCSWASPSIPSPPSAAPSCWPASIS
jgi:drug/metabolite transporter (DMT)-like permease